MKLCQDIKLAWQTELDTLVPANRVFGDRGSCCGRGPMEGDTDIIPAVKPRTLSVLEYSSTVRVLKLGNYKVLYTI